jgi:hypothetical protein
VLEVAMIEICVLGWNTDSGYGLRSLVSSAP